MPKPSLIAEAFSRDGEQGRKYRVGLCDYSCEDLMDIQGNNPWYRVVVVVVVVVHRPSRSLFGYMRRNYNPVSILDLD